VETNDDFSRDVPSGLSGSLPQNAMENEKEGQAEADE
jgi:hypothetical protein